MINLLPTSEKIRLAKSYQRRLFIVLLSFSTTALFLGVFFLITPYRLAKEKTITVVNNADIVSSLTKNREISNPEFVFKEIQKRLDLLASRGSRPLPSVLVRRVLDNRPNGVTLNGFTYGQNSDGSQGVEIRGVAVNRDDLLVFTRALEAEPKFAKVAVPVSSFVKNKNLDFAILVSTKAPPEKPQP